MVIEACRAGKDVYIEKPLTYAPAEGPRIVKAVRETGRVVQVGMQQRSGAHYMQAKSEYFDTGRIGKVTLVRTIWHGNGWHLRKPSFTEKPAGLDWERFVGPRPKRPFSAHQFWNWRAYLDYGGGQITDLFTHWIDVVQWFMKEDQPAAAVASGGVYHYRDGRTAPDTINVLLEYPGNGGWTATFEATLAPGARGAAIEFNGTEGRLSITRGGYTFQPPKGDPVEVKADGKGDFLTQAHVDDFLACLGTRGKPRGDVLTGHRSALSSHLGNIAYLQKRRVVMDRAWV
jgi:predicted dehydrogenase